MLAWEPLGQRLVLEQVYDHQGNLSAGMVPLLLLDMWELSSLSGILLDELAEVTGRSRGEVMPGLHLRYLGADRGHRANPQQLAVRIS